MVLFVDMLSAMMAGSFPLMLHACSAVLSNYQYGSCPLDKSVKLETTDKLE